MRELFGTFGGRAYPEVDMVRHQAAQHLRDRWEVVAQLLHQGTEHSRDPMLVVPFWLRSTSCLLQQIYESLLQTWPPAWPNG